MTGVSTPPIKNLLTLLCGPVACRVAAPPLLLVTASPSANGPLLTVAKYK